MRLLETIFKESFSISLPFAIYLYKRHIKMYIYIDIVIKTWSIKDYEKGFFSSPTRKKDPHCNNRFQLARKKRTKSYTGKYLFK